MAAYNGLDDVQPQAPAIPVLGAALVQLVEPVKDQLQLLLADFDHVAVADAPQDLLFGPFLALPQRLA